jgi:coenzyme F420 hydrogenase subunit beta
LERKKNRRATYERLGCDIPEPPIPGYSEKDEIVSDEQLLKISGMK